MAKEICTVCGREIDSRGMSGHMKTHVSKEDDTDGVISYPSHPVKGTHSKSEVPSNEQEIEETDTVVDLDVPQGKRVKKPVKKPVASKPASSPASKPDADGQRKTETEHKEEWKGFFRD